MPVDAGADVVVLRTVVLLPACEVDVTVPAPVTVVVAVDVVSPIVVVETAVVVDSVVVENTVAVDVAAVTVEEEVAELTVERVDEEIEVEGGALVCVVVVCVVETVEDAKYVEEEVDETPALMLSTCVEPRTPQPARDVVTTANTTAVARPALKRFKREAK